MEIPFKILWQQSKIQGVDNIILVTIGTSSFQFDRLIEELNGLVKSGEIKEKIICVIGNSPSVPKNMEYFRFISFDEYKKLVKKSDVVVTHGGIGSVLLSLKMKKPTIVVPRRKKFKEHTNDHQVQVTKELEKDGYIMAVYEISELKEAIKKIKNNKPINLRPEPDNNIIETIDNYIKSLKKNKQV